MELSLVSLCICLAHVFPVFTSKPEEPPRECGGQHVCTTLMKYTDGTTVDEGDYCFCREGRSACSKEWDDSDEKSLTWQHYERVMWTVQYRFCTPVFHEKNVCRPGEMAAVVETDVKKWQPYVSNPRCVCENDVTLKITGWKREGAVWKYFYFCEKEECVTPDQTVTDESMCAKIYIDTGKSEDKVNEVKFLCSCPEGFLCPAKYDQKWDKKVQHDESGQYVAKMCEAVVQNRRAVV